MPKVKTNDVELMVEKKLFEMQDLEYKEFHRKLMPTVNPDRIIGVRTPILRKFAVEFSKTDDAKIFLNHLPHKYYDENNLHAFLIERIKNYNETVERIDEFLPYIDNWATCDLMSPKIFKKHTDELYIKIGQWLKSDELYTLRFAIEMLMSFYLDDKFNEEILEIVAGVSSEEYYLNMMIAWFFATALAKQYDATIPYLEKRKLDIWTHNKTIQKAIESRRIDDNKKKYLRTLKIK